MRLRLVALVSVLLLAALQASAAGAAQPASEASAISTRPQPTATYVSELGTAVVLPPRPAHELPSSGGGGAANGRAWPTAIGLTLAVLGMLLIQASRLYPKPSA